MEFQYNTGRIERRPQLITNILWEVDDRRLRTIALLAAMAWCLLWPGIVGHVSAQLPAGRPEVCAPSVGTAPTLDGVLDDQAWQQAAKIDRFVQETPRDGEPATDSTEAWLAYDSSHLYFAFHVRYGDLSMVRANFSDRDQIGEDDTVSVFLDPFLDQQRAYQFSVNGRGVQGDAILTGADDDDDDSWDALFESKGRLVDDGWVVEFAIPFKSLRYPARSDGEHRWGLQLRRTTQAKDERDVWAPISRDIDSFLNQMGILCGLRNLSTSRNLEILPTLTAVQFGARDDEGLRYVERPVDPTAGLNVKYGLSSDMTLDFAVNPDFSQIEADNPRITLNQRFPIFYEEKRPFFLEGQEIFATEAGGDTTILHTRTLVDPFLGLKLTGKTAKMTMGIIAANDQAPGRRDDPDDPASGKTRRCSWRVPATISIRSRSSAPSLPTGNSFGPRAGWRRGRPLSAGRHPESELHVREGRAR